MGGAPPHTPRVDECGAPLLSVVALVSDATPLVLATTEPTRPSATEEQRVDGTRVARGVCVGRFILIEEVGSGGGGQVWRAFDPELDRTIAIKLLHGKPGGIVTEAQALAKVAHPNVARIHDVGTVQLDRLYAFLAVEFVEGPTLAEFCKSLREQGGQARRIVRTFIALGQGLAAVHDEGLVHRDLKPTNALINREGQPMLVDFGLAQPERGGPREEEASLMLVAGTLGYMPPEQHRGMAVSAASDTYAFCAALWEALCGQLPFAGASAAALLEAKQAGVTEGSAPQAIPRRVARVLVRGLHPDASQRFTDVRSLLLALERINAPRRWPIALLGTALVGGALALAAGQETYDPCVVELGEAWTDTRRSAVETSMLQVDVPYGRHAMRSTVAELDRWADSWVSSRRDACDAALVRGGVEGDTYALQAECYDRALSRFVAAVRVLETSDASTIEGANELLAELHAPAHCEDGPGLRASGSIPPSTASDAAATSEARRLLDAVDVNRASGHLDKAERLLTQARGVSATNAHVLASLELAAGSLALAQEDHEAAQSGYRDGLSLALEAGDWALVHAATVALIDLVGTHQGQTEEALRYREFAEGLVEGDLQARTATLLALGSVYRRAGQSDDALRSYEGALTLQQQRYGEDSLQAATVYSELGVLLAKSEPLRGVELAQRALDIRRERLGPGHPEVTRAMIRLAWSQAAVGRLPEQIALLERALEGVRTGTVEEAEVEHALGGALLHMGRCEDAGPHVLRAVELGVEPDAELDLRSANYLFHLGGLYNCQGRLGDAQAQLERVLEARTNLLGSAHTDVAEVFTQLAQIHVGRGHGVRAAELQEQALEIWLQAVGEEHIEVASSRAALANTLRALGQSNDAAEHLRAALDVYERGVGLKHPDALFASATLADTLLDVGEVDEAVTLARFAWTHLSANPSAPPVQRGYVSFVLALALWGTDDASSRREAINYAKVAITNLEQAGEADRAASVRAWLAEAQP